MPDDTEFDEIDRILRQDQFSIPSSISTANEQNCRKRLRCAELIATNDKLVRRVKEFETQLQQLQCTASEVSKLYEKEKELRIELEHRTRKDDECVADLENQLDVQKLRCEQLEEEMKVKCLPVDAKNVAITFVQLANRIAQDPCSGGLTRMEQNMQQKLRDYCKLANFSIPPCKISTKKRTKVASAVATTTSSTQTVELPMSVETSKPEMCSIAVQSEKLVTTRDQGMQHKNTTTTRSTTTASFIKMHDVGTCFPEPKPELTAHQILDKMLLWTIEPLSPINDDFPATEGIDIGTCTELCNVNREINFLPDMPAQLKHSDSRPPSRSMYDCIKDEQTMPVDAPTSDGSDYPMAKKLLSFLPGNQSILTKMSPQVFDEVWQVMVQMLHVALASSISQADFHRWFDTLIVESHQAHSIAGSSKGESHTVLQSNSSASEASKTDAINSPTNEVPLDIGLDLTPIRLPPKPDCKQSKSKPKTIRTTPYSRPQAPQQQDVAQPRSTSPTETAVNFLTNLNAFRDKNCDNFDFQITAEEQQLLRRTSAILESSQTSGLSKKLTEMSRNSLDVRLDAMETAPQPTGGPLDRAQIPQGLIQTANITQGSKEHLLELFGSESSSEDEEPAYSTPSREKGIVESNGNGADDVPMTVKKSNVDTNGTQPSEATSPKSRLPACRRQRKISTLSSSDSESESNEEANIVNKDSTESLALPVAVTSDAHEGKDVNAISIDRRPFLDEEQPVSDLLEKSDSMDICLGLDDVHDSKTNKTESPLNSLESECRDRTKDMLTGAGTSETLEQDSDEDSESDDSDSDVDSSLVINDDLHTDLAEDEDQKCLQSESMQQSASSSSESQMGPSEEASDSEQNVSSSSECQVGPNDETTNSEQNASSSFESQMGLNEERSDTDAYTLVLKTCIPDQLSAIESPVKQRLGKRKRSTSTSSEDQPMEKRVTRWQLKQMSMEKSKLTEESQSSSAYDWSPMSPVNSASSEVIGSEPIEIPLDSPEDEQFTDVPKALASYLINAVKADAKKRGNRKKRPNKKQRDQLKKQIVDYLNQRVPLDKASAQLEAVEDQLLLNVLIEVYGELAIGKNVNLVECLLALLDKLDCQRCSFVERFTSSLEQRLFSIKDRLPDQVAHEFVKLQLQLYRLQAIRANPAESYINPARLLLAKILYHYSKQMSSLVMEVLCQFPTVLPHREERDYDHGDPLITVIKHLLMCHQYDVSNPNGTDRALISKLRYEYHFQPYEPTKQKVIENLVEKVKAGRSHELSYAFALFCRRSANLNVINVVDKELLPLAHNYCDQCLQSEEYDTRMVCLLQCISMIIKQLRLDSITNIENYVGFFKRILMVAPRPAVQEAAVQAILRLQRFGYAFVLDALQGYRPSYQLTPLTRAMLRSFAERRHQYMSHPRVAL